MGRIVSALQRPTHTFASAWFGKVSWAAPAKSDLFHSEKMLQASKNQKYDIT